MGTVCWRPSVLLLLLLTILGCSRPSNPGPIVIGHLNPTQNDDEMNGISFAIEAINADSDRYVAGRKLRVIHAGAGNSTDEVQGQAVRLLNVDKVEGLIGTSSWNTVEKLGRTVQSPMTLSLSLNGYTGTMTNTSLFAVGISPIEEGKIIARYGRESLKATEATVLIEADATVPALVARSFVDSFGKEGKIVVEHLIKTGEAPDFLKDLGGQKSEIIVLCGSAKQLFAWRSKIKAGSHLFFGGEESEIPELQSNVDPTKIISAVMSFHSADQTPAAQEFTRKFKERHGKFPSTSAVLAHDAVCVFAEAARRAGTSQAEKMREQLLMQDASFELLTGSLGFGPDQLPRRPLFIVQLDSKGPQLERRYEP